MGIVFFSVRSESSGPFNVRCAKAEDVIFHTNTSGSLGALSFILLQISQCPSNMELCHFISLLPDANWKHTVICLQASGCSLLHAQRTDFLLFRQPQLYKVCFDKVGSISHSIHVVVFHISMVKLY